MRLLVQKYGGSSLATPNHIRNAALRIKSVRESGDDVVVVASAMGRTTDHLIRLAQKTVRVPPEREMDMLLTAGERVSMSLLSMALQELGVPAISFTGSQSGIVTSSRHTEARIIDIRAHRIREALSKHKVVIIAGFQGVSEEKEITTLGRGGSDTTAMALTVALGAYCCEILTDVDGLYSADPRIVANARLLPFCSYNEALELASLGAKMHSRSIELAKRYKVKVRIASSQKTDCSGTFLSDFGFQGGDDMEETIIRGIATKYGYHFFKVAASLDELLERLSEHQIPLRFFNYSAGWVSFLSEKEAVAVVRKLIRDAFGDFEEVSDMALISAVGDGMSQSSGIIPTFLRTIRDNGTNCRLICSNALSITAAVEKKFVPELAKQLHDKLVVKANN